MKIIVAISIMLLSQGVFGQAQADSLKKGPVCPVCHDRKDVVPVVYGKPSSETIKRCERGECWLGGCVVDRDSPSYYCKKDKKLF